VFPAYVKFVVWGKFFWWGSLRSNPPYGRQARAARLFRGRPLPWETHQTARASLLPRTWPTRLGRLAVGPERAHQVAQGLGLGPEFLAAGGHLFRAGRRPARSPGRCLGGLGNLLGIGGLLHVAVAISEILAAVALTLSTIFFSASPVSPLSCAPCCTCCVDSLMRLVILAGCLVGPLGQLAHFVGHHGESAAVARRPGPPRSPRSAPAGWSGWQSPRSPEWISPI